MTNKRVLFPLVAAAILVVTGCSPVTPSQSSSAAGGNSSNSSAPAASSSQAPAASSSSSSVAPKSYYDNPTTDEVTLRLSVHYQDAKTEMRFEHADYSNYKDPKGNTYQKDDFKPAWKALQSRLNFTIDDVHKGSKVDDSYDDQKNNTSGAFTGCDVLVGKASGFAQDGTKGDYFVNLLDYLDYMPNFDKFLSDNPIVKLTITSNAYTTDGTVKPAVYYAPYFDGFDDLERMTLLRVDWVKKLLDETGVTYDTATTITPKYNGVMNKTAKQITVPADANGSTTKKLNKNQTTNIIERMNNLAVKNGSTFVQELRNYIDETYGTQYEKRSDLFCGYNAAYDADEFVALLRCVKANPQCLAGVDNVTPFMPRASSNDRVADLYRWAGQLFGLRGMESRSNFLYVNTEGKIKDARGNAKTAHLLTLLNQLYQEGLILNGFDVASTTASGAFGTDIVQEGTGFAMYDYCQSQTAMNNLVNRENAALTNFDFEPVLGAVADLDDGVEGNYIHFSESWRSVKTEGWGLSKAGIGNDQAKLMRALKLVDYFYSTDGNELMSFGPREYGYIATNADGSIQTISYNGKQVPKLSDGMLAQLADKKIGNSNYTNYYRYFVGSTYPVGYIKQQGMEYQCTSEQGKAGLAKIAAAINAGTLKHPLVDNLAKGDAADPFYDTVPTSFRVTAGQSDAINALTNLKKISYEKLKSGINEWDKYVMNGYGGTYGTGAAAETLKASEAELLALMTEWGVNTFANTYNDAYEVMVSNFSA